MYTWFRWARDGSESKCKLASPKIPRCALLRGMRDHGQAAGRALRGNACLAERWDLISRGYSIDAAQSNGKHQGADPKGAGALRARESRWQALCSRNSVLVGTLIELTR